MIQRSTLAHGAPSRFFRKQVTVFKSKGRRVKVSGVRSSIIAKPSPLVTSLLLSLCPLSLPDYVVGFTMQPVLQPRSNLLNLIRLILAK